MDTLSNINSKLNDALAKNFDAINGYKKAKDEVKSSELQGFFQKQINERLNFANELSSEIVSLGGQPVTEGTFAGSVHRKWMDVTTALSSDKEEEIIEECIRGEKAAVEEYDDILESEIPANSRIQSIISSHKQEIISAVNSLEVLEDKY